MNHDKSLREHLLYLLNGDGAHQDFDAVTKDIPADLRGKKPKGAPHSPWELLEHLRITQWDVLESIRNRDHVSPEFPAGYWPGSAAPPDDKAWDKSVQAFKTDSTRITDLLKEDSSDLFAELPHAEGQTIVRKLFMLADHNAYHLGQLLLLRRLLGAWQ
jgi:DinB superfamily